MLYKKSLFIFRRDLRLTDNTALHKALQESKIVLPCFIADPRQISAKNKYRSTRAIQFMAESLQELARDLQKHKAKLYIFHGIAEDIVYDIIIKEKIDAVFCNRDYTPFSIKRDEHIRSICLKNNAQFIQTDDALLNSPEQVLTNNQTPYTIFTAYYKKALALPVPKPKKLPKFNFYTKKISTERPAILKDLVKQHMHNAITGGTQPALKILKNLKKFNNYAQQRDFPAKQTTMLSAHNKFGTVSIRQAFHAIGKNLGYNHSLLRQLYWRDFFTQVAYFSPYVFGQPFHKKFEKLPWKNNKAQFKRWCEGTTGFPIIDAGMRQLNETGFMHNRVRMLVASFLTKDLHIDWLWGERYFAQQLIDYDPAINNGNWQWCASTGCDAQPYFRIFNPWLQQKKFDPNCIYIKRWIPELQHVPPKIIHTWYVADHPAIKGYPRPIVNHAQESMKAKQYYKKAAQR